MIAPFRGSSAAAAGDRSAGAFRDAADSPIECALAADALPSEWTTALAALCARVGHAGETTIGAAGGVVRVQWADDPGWATLRERVETNPIEADAGATLRVGADAVRTVGSDGVEMVVSIANAHEAGPAVLAADPACFDRESVERLAAYLTRLLAAGRADPDCPVSRLEMLADTERRQIVSTFNDTTTDYPRDDSVVACFERVVDRCGDAIAIECGERVFRYDEVDRQANRLAHALIARGVAPGDFVGLAVPRSAEMIVAALAILKAGAAYVPLEPSYPAARIEGMLEDAAVRHVVALDAATLPIDESRRVLDLTMDAREVDGSPDSRPSLSVSAAATAYVMFTSGSTGRPKGVRTPHRGITRLALESDFATFPPEERVLCFAPSAFDASTLEIYGPLLNGGTVVVFPAGLHSLATLAEFIRAQRVSTAWLTAALFHEMVDLHLEELGGLRQLLAGGDVLSPSHCQRVIDTLEHTTLVNGYGPTENTTFTCCHRMSPGERIEGAIPVGRPIADTTVYILGAQGEVLPVGVAGELYAGGDGVADGYLARPELTAERFVPDPFCDRPDARLYRTGDLAAWRPDGSVEFLGRADAQVKIRGYRIELGEIEVALATHPDLRQVAVVPVDVAGDRRLAAYVVPNESATAPNVPEVRHYLADRLPDYMLPSHVVSLDQLPVTANGKLDRAKLPDVDAGHGASVPSASASSALVQTLTEAFSRVLGIDAVEADTHFFDWGGSSLLALRLIEVLSRDFDLEVPAVALFQEPTPGGLAALLEGGADAASVSARRAARARRAGAAAWGADPDARAIAVVGMSGRFPGAGSVAEMWEVLVEGRETTSFFRPDEIDSAVDPAIARADDYVRARGILGDADCFDARFFGIAPRMAEVTDPQQRLFLETAWEALEDAGYVPETTHGAVGVFGGTGFNSYQRTNLDTHPELVDAIGELPLQYVNEKDYAPIHVSHKLDLDGPAISVHTACSTSLVAIVQACDALRAGRCDMALAGGVAVRVPMKSGHRYVEGGMGSADGHTRTFDAEATGTVFSDGAAIVVLKRLADAEADGDTIHAVIRGTGLNNDGSNRASFSAPNPEGQANVIRMALADAGWSADSISYVEAHGTATPLGDPIEVDGLSQAFRDSTDRTGFCAIGSIKSNMGHLTAAAGAAGLIKTVLSLEHQLLPASLHYTAPNPRIDFPSTPFFVNAERRAWETDGTPRRAGVSSFGVGGTNAHVLLEEYEPDPSTRPSRSHAVLRLSARSAEALDRAGDRLAAHLEASSGIDLADLAYTLERGRRGCQHRRIVVASDRASAIEALRNGTPKTSLSGRAPKTAPEVVFMFPGQGAQYPNMGRSLYEDEPVFRQAMDQGLAVLREALDLDLGPILYPEVESEAAAADILRRTEYTQPAIFLVSYALARTWMGWGLEPSALVGHSIGEYVAATLADVMAFEDAARLVALRGRMVQALPAGGMLSVRAPSGQVESMLPDGLDLACANAPGLSVVAGPHEVIEAFVRDLEKAQIECRGLHTSHAFHSHMMDPVVAAFEAEVREVALSAPRRRIASTVNGDWLSDADACDPSYWARHLRQTVRFEDAIGCLDADGGDRVYLEIGPRNTTATFARQVLRDRQQKGSRQRVVATLDVGADTHEEPIALFRSIGQLWLHGVATDPEAFWLRERRRRVPLPTYPFERERYWIERASSVTAPAAAAAPAGVVEQLVQQQLGVLARQIELLKASSSGGD